MYKYVSHQKHITPASGLTSVHIVVALRRIAGKNNRSSEVLLSWGIKSSR